jgi:hypothetical protein
MRKACPRSLRGNRLDDDVKEALKKAAGSQVDLQF